MEMAAFTPNNQFQMRENMRSVLTGIGFMVIISFTPKFWIILKLTNGKAMFSMPFNGSRDFYNYQLNVTVAEEFSNESSWKLAYLRLVDAEFYATSDVYSFSPNKSNTFKARFIAII
jgi:hypothetical protein